MKRWERRAIRNGWREPLSADHDHWEGKWLPEYDAAAKLVQDELDGATIGGRVAWGEYHGDRAVVALLLAGWRPATDDCLPLVGVVDFHGSLIYECDCPDAEMGAHFEDCPATTEDL